MLSTKSHQRPVFSAVLVATATAILMSGAAFASKTVVQDRRISAAQADELAKHARSESGFPIVVNDLVLTELNRFIGTPDGREYMRNALARMEQYRGMIQPKLDQYQVPSEILALPIVESAYQNLPENGHAGHGAGLWMFIRTTAQHFGLKVDSQNR